MDKIQDGHFSKSEVIGHYGRDEKKNVQAELKTVESKVFFFKVTIHLLLPVKV